MTQLDLGPILYLGKCSSDWWEFHINVTIRDGGATVPLIEVDITSGDAVVNEPVIAANFNGRAGVDLVIWRATVRARRQDVGSTLAYRVSAAASGEIKGLPVVVEAVAIPAKNCLPALAFFSCNGVDDQKSRNRLKRIYGMWEKLLTRHAKEPYHAMVGGGDQLYADVLWDNNYGSSALRRFDSPLNVRDADRLSPVQRARLLRHYAELYCERWSNDAPALAHSQIPGAFTWDDHDIFDGWGSYQDDRQKMEVMQGVFEAARLAFQAFQLGTSSALGGAAPPAQLGDGSHALQAFELHTADTQLDLLLLDGRSDRAQTRVLSDTQWDSIKTWLDESRELRPRHLLVISSMPLVYMDFSAALRVFELTPGHQDLEDDMRDHWLSCRHRGERRKLIMNLFDHCKETRTRVTILSGDVHVGARGRFESRNPRHRIDGHDIEIEQLISSGIVYPPPTAEEFWFVRSAGTEFRTEAGDRVTSDVVPIGGDHYYLRDRNYLSIRPEHFEGGYRLWFEYVAEHVELPECVVLDSLPV